VSETGVAQLQPEGRAMGVSGGPVKGIRVSPGRVEIPKMPPSALFSAQAGGRKSVLVSNAPTRESGYARAGVCVSENDAFTDSRERTTIVNTPRIVPKG